MIRMRSPVYFENVFGDFSIIPIWFLRNRIQQSIDLPVVCQSSSRNQKIAEGCIIRSSKTGALLQGRFRQSLELVVDSGYIYHGALGFESYDLGQTVDRVLMLCNDIGFPDTVFRWDTNVHHTIKERIGSGLIWCEFCGRYFYYAGVPGASPFSVRLYGYKFI